ncbi:MAG: sulfurtransferase [Magnetococcales bacterium]|nr:sulfurtransferase [Magnetococcales bacterium]
MKRRLSPPLVSLLAGALILGLLIPNQSKAALSLPGPVVTTQWLADHSDQVTVLDVRKQQSFSRGGFIPGAVFVPFERLTQTRTVEGLSLRLMVPDRPTWEKLLSESGVSTDDLVVITGLGEQWLDLARVVRLYWSMKQHGHQAVAILEGGNARWQVEQRGVSDQSRTPLRTRYKSSQPSTNLVVGMVEVEKAALTSEVQLVDVRALKFYTGDQRYEAVVPPQGVGHIPGALNLPIQLLLDRVDGAVWFQHPDDMVEMADMMDVDLTRPTILYCDTGNYAGLAWFVLHERLNNQEARLFDGSMHQWSRANKPVRQGEEP